MGVTRKPAAAVGFFVAMAITGCTTHDAKFDSNAPPPTVNQTQLRTTIYKLISAPAKELTALSPATLAALTSAASDEYSATHGTVSMQFAEMYANPLLGAGVSLGKAIIFPGAIAGKIDPETTLQVGDALVSVATIPGQSASATANYRTAVSGIVSAFRDRAFGLRPYRRGLVIRDSSGQGSVSLTAHGAEFLNAAQALTGRSTIADVRGLTRTVVNSQAAVGRWYAFVGSRIPMTLSQWATTLAGLERLPGPTPRGILGGGVPALWSATFRPDGTVRSGVSAHERAPGLPQAMLALAAWANPRYADLAITSALQDLSPSGSWRAAGRGSTEAEALFSLALARFDASGA